MSSADLVEWMLSIGWTLSSFQSRDDLQLESRLASLIQASFNTTDDSAIAWNLTNCYLCAHNKTWTALPKVLWLVCSKLCNPRYCSRIWRWLEDRSPLWGLCHCSDCAKPRIDFNLLLGCQLVLGLVQLSYGPLLDQIWTFLILHMSGIKLELLCGGRVELAYEPGMFVLFSGLTRKGVLPSMLAPKVSHNP